MPSGTVESLAKKYTNRVSSGDSGYLDWDSVHLVSDAVAMACRAEYATSGLSYVTCTLPDCPTEEDVVSVVEKAFLGEWDSGTWDGLYDTLTDLSWWKEQPAACFIYVSSNMFLAKPDLLGGVFSVFLFAAQFWAGGSKYARQRRQSDQCKEYKEFWERRPPRPFELFLVVGSDSE